MATLLWSRGLMISNDETIGLCIASHRGRSHTRKFPNHFSRMRAFVCHDAMSQIVTMRECMVRMYRNSLMVNPLVASGLQAFYEEDMICYGIYPLSFLRKLLFEDYLVMDFWTNGSGLRRFICTLPFSLTIDEASSLCGETYHVDVQKPWTDSHRHALYGLLCSVYRFNRFYQFLTSFTESVEDQHDWTRCTTACLEYLVVLQSLLNVSFGSVFMKEGYHEFCNQVGKETDIDKADEQIRIYAARYNDFREGFSALMEYLEEFPNAFAESMIQEVESQAAMVLTNL